MAAPSTRVYKVPCKVRKADNNRRSKNNADLRAEHDADHGTNHVTKYVLYITNHQCTIKSRKNTVKR